MLNSVDVIIIIVYLSGTIAIGLKSRGKQETAEDYFTATGGFSGSFQSIIVGLSIAATFFSGLSFLIYPSIGYSNGIVILMCLFVFPIVWILLHFWFLPRYFAAKCKHPYDIIETNIGSQTRTLAASMFILLRIGWMAAMLYAPTIAFMAMGDLEQQWFWPIVLILGLSCTLYTTFGGIRGVIVTDAIQMVVIIVGITFTIAYILIKLPVPFSEVLNKLTENDHLKLFNFTLNPTVTFSTWAILVGIFFSSMATYMADQMSLQRYLAMNSLKSASRSFGLNILGVMVVILLLVSVGVLLFAWYAFVPEENLPASPDKILPYFVATRLPVGVSGLLLAAILAATISSMTSGINTLAGTLTLDFRIRFGSPMTARQQLRYGRIASFAVGLSATLIAGLVSRLGTIFDISQTLLGLFLGPLLSIILLAIYRTKVNQAVIIISSIIAFLIGTLAVYTSLSSLWISPITCITSLTLSVLGSRIFPPKTLPTLSPTQIPEKRG